MHRPIQILQTAEDDDSMDDGSYRSVDEDDDNNLFGGEEYGHYFDKESESNVDDRDDSESSSSSEPVEDDTGTTSTKYDPSLRPLYESETTYQQDIGIPNAWKFMVDLTDMIDKRRVDLKLQEDFNNLLKKHTIKNVLKFSPSNLQSRQGFINSALEKSFASKGLRPKDVNVKLTGGNEATVSTFDVEAMILSLLHDEELMKEENLAPGYDLHTGKSVGDESHYGEIHTGDAWEPARKHFCGDHPQNMPIALIIFGDKSHFDKHGVLSTTPICFTLSCFNEEARKKVDFWRPIAYLPNLDLHKVEGMTKTQQARQSVQDEHFCLMAALKSLVAINKKNGIATVVKGKSVIGKVWIHYIIGNCSGNNRWLGHFNGSGKMKRPYRDCRCGYPHMGQCDPHCTYIRPEEVDAARKVGTQKAMKDISKHDIENAFMQEARGVNSTPSTGGLPLPANTCENRLY